MKQILISLSYSLHIQSLFITFVFMHMVISYLRCSSQDTCRTMEGKWGGSAKINNKPTRVDKEESTRYRNLLQFNWFLMI